jgi:hypothetical protein
MKEVKLTKEELGRIRLKNDASVAHAAGVGGTISKCGAIS